MSAPSHDFDAQITAFLISLLPIAALSTLIAMAALGERARNLKAAVRTDRGLRRVPSTWRPSRASLM